MSEVIDVDFGADAADAPTMRVKKRHHTDCEHDAVDLDDKLRVVTCRKCGERLDPIQVLTDIANLWNVHWRRLENVRRERQRLAAAIEDMKRQKRNLQAQVRRIRQKGKAT